MSFAVPDLVARLRAAGCVFAEDEARVLRDSAHDDAELEALAARRIAGEPLEVVVGWAEFCGLRLVVAPGLFVPRPRSEFLVETAVAMLGERRAVVVDVCSGTGALGAAVRARSAVAELHAVDVDPDAVACARRNLPGAAVYAGESFDPLPARLRDRVDLVLANAPYVPSDDIALLPHEARDFEHRVALDGGADGLDVQRAIIAAAPRWLAPGGSLLVETGRHQAAITGELMTAAGLGVRVASDDDRDATVVVGTTARP